MKATVRKPTGAAFMLRCCELGLTDDALASMTMGMVYDLLIEKQNDSHKYNYKMTQEDIDGLFL